MVSEPQCRRTREALMAAIIATFPALGGCSIVVVGYQPDQTLERSTPYISRSIWWKASMGRPKLISERPCCTLLCPSGRNFLCLSTDGMVCTLLCLDIYLLATSFSRKTLYNRHSGGCRYWNLHGVGCESFVYPKISYDPGLTVPGYKPWMVLFFRLPLDIPNGRTVGSDAECAESCQVHNARSTH